MNEIKLKLGSAGTSYRFRTTFLCKTSLRRKIDLPLGAETLYAVFTKTKTPDAFTITPDNSPTSQVMAGVAEYRGSLAYGVRRILFRQKKAGFGFVHFEYDEETE